MNAKDARTANNGVELQHRHFSFIAATIKAMPDDQIRYACAQQFVAACAKTNSKFDRARFLAACGFDHG
jgi:hypothetical protein